MFWFRSKMWSVAFVVLLLPCYMFCVLCAYPFLSLLNTLSSLSTLRIDVSPDFIQKVCWWLYVPAALMAARAAFAVLAYVERKMFGPPVRYYRHRRW
ncbi:MAG: hypothetical protein ABSA97_06650 [Verrucomicrobiia bacterium]